MGAGHGQWRLYHKTQPSVTVELCLLITGQQTTLVDVTNSDLHCIEPENICISYNSRQVSLCLDKLKTVFILRNDYLL